MSTAIAVNSQNWQAEVINSQVPVLVDFWAEWCGPCKALGPILDDLSKDLGDKLNIVKVNVDESQDLAAKFIVRSIPMLLIIKSGVVKDQMIGLMNKNALRAKVDPHLVQGPVTTVPPAPPAPPNMGR